MDRGEAPVLRHGGSERLPGYYDTRINRLKRPLYGLRNRWDDLTLNARARLADAIEHVHGPREVPTGPDEVVLVCLVRNGELWVRSFLQHHLGLGVKHVFFLDNGSTDDTLALIRAHDAVSVWRTELPFRRYELAFRRWLVRNFGRDRWTLWCDVDELFDYPFSDVLPLSAFLAYLRSRSFKVVAAQMLDMFSYESFRDLDSRPGDSIKEKYPFYDLTGLKKRRDVFWIDDDRPHHADLFCTFGGVRERVFGSRNLLQTKHPLVYADEDVRFLPYDGHFSTGPVADVTGVLLHYKFLSNLLDYAREALRRKQHSRDSLHYRRFHRVLSEKPDLSLWTERARRLEQASQLVEEGLLTVSDEFRRWVEAHGTESEVHASFG